MKKRYLILTLVLLLWGCAARDPLAEISAVIGVDVTGASLSDLTDSHGGFLGDGETVAQIVLTAPQREALLTGVQESEYWHPLPLSAELSAAIYGSRTGNLVLNPLFTDENGDPLLPPIENGCYFFLDRNSQSTDPASSAGLHDRASWNFTAAVYDADQNILYYLELDT